MREQRLKGHFGLSWGIFYVDCRVSKHAGIASSAPRTTCYSQILCRPLSPHSPKSLGCAMSFATSFFWRADCSNKLESRFTSKRTRGMNYAMSSVLILRSPKGKMRSLVPGRSLSFGLGFSRRAYEDLMRRNKLGAYKTDQ
jgi:hypothetical protein